uniref:Protein arginine N-methyltransferase domain-containing protein n=1 Tax=Aegilops tauschii TaxID=37682 RepID=M8BP42_AEGTA
MGTKFTGEWICSSRRHACTSPHARAAAAFLRSRPPEVDKRASLLGGASHPVVGLDGDAEETVKPPRPRSLRERSSRATVAPSKPPYPPDFRSPPARRQPRRGGASYLHARRDRAGWEGSACPVGEQGVWPRPVVQGGAARGRVRTDAYREAIMLHQKFIEGKVVMDVGCGTGILSVFCARAGAKRVYAVDASEIATQASEIVKANNLADKIVDVDVEEKVDVIISEWMGYMLLYESMLPSVLFARDKWLKPGGLILPSHATLFMAPITNSDRYEGSVDFWCDVYGINMSALVPLAKKFASEEPSIEIVGGENVISWPFVVKHIDCYTFTVEEFKSITTTYKVSSMMLAPIHGFGLWFEVEFNGPAESCSNLSSDSSPLDIIQKKRRRASDSTVVLSTAPEDEPTHWHQTILYFPDPIGVTQDQIIEGSVTITPSEENPRCLNIHLECS